MDPEGLSILRNLEEIYRNFRHLEAKALSVRRAKLSLNEWGIIEKLGERVQKMRLGDLAAARGVKTASMTVAVDKLSAKGFLMRRPMEEDRRGVYVLLTRRGRAAYKMHKNFQNDMLDFMLGGLREEELKALASAFVRLKGFMEQYG